MRWLFMLALVSGCTAHHKRQAATHPAASNAPASKFHTESIARGEDLTPFYGKTSGGPVTLEMSDVVLRTGMQFTLVNSGDEPWVMKSITDHCSVMGMFGPRLRIGDETWTPEGVRFRTFCPSVEPQKVTFTLAPGERHDVYLPSGWYLEEPEAGLIHHDQPREQRPLEPGTYELTLQFGDTVLSQSFDVLPG